MNASVMDKPSKEDQRRWAAERHNRIKPACDAFREEFEALLRKHSARCEWAQINVAGIPVVYSQ